jgi:hypothetical protein
LIAVIKGTGFINEQELSAMSFGSGFRGITDIETGPDGLLYVLTIADGIIYKISPGMNLGENENALHAQRVPAKRNIDDRFAVVFSTVGVNNDTGYAINWVTANNATNVLFYNASAIDLKDNRQDGFIETALSLPNGTIHIGDEYKACTTVLKDDNIICNTGLNWPGGRAEYNSIMFP